MKPAILYVLLLCSTNLFSQRIHKYNPAPKDTIVDIYFNDSIVDEYQWMEDPTDVRLATWLEQQNRITKKLSNKQTRKFELRNQISAMYHGVRRNDINTTKDEFDEHEYSKYEFKTFANNINRSPDLHYKKKDTDDYRRLIKAKDFQESKNDHLNYEVSAIDSKNDIAFIKISINGSDWSTGYFFDLKNETITGDTLYNLRNDGQASWYKQKLYFFQYAPPKKGRELLDVARAQKLCLYDIQTNKLKILQHNPDTTGTNNISYYKSKNKLFLYHYLKVQSKTYKAISVADLDNDTFFPQNFLIYPNTNQASLKIGVVKGDSVFLKSFWQAKNGAVFLANTKHRNKIINFIPEYDIRLKTVNELGKDKLACIYHHKGQDIAMIYNYKGELLKKIEFPTGKKVSGLYELQENVNNTIFSLSSFYHPRLYYSISLETLEFKPIESLYVPYDPSKLETRYIEYSSKDGTKVPMYITCKKGIKLDKKNNVLIYAYGGYGITIEPNFDESIGLWLLHGGILVVPNIRGGGAKGNNWAIEGRGLKKQNGIDDFISSAEYLINEGYTNPEHIAINGGSHGGLIVGAAMTQRPELFKAVIAEAGVYDMLRAHKYTAGAVNININEFGIPNDLENYKNLYSYSPLHAIKRGIKYPNLLLITGQTDDRVPPHHSYKFLAKLQMDGDPQSLYHLFLSPGAGHGGALTEKDRIDAHLYKYYFLFDQLKVDFF